VNPLDLGVVAIIVLSALFAFARGFVREALSILAWIGAAAATLYGFNAAFTLIDPIVKNPLLSQVIAGFGLFVGSLIVLTIITSFIARMVRASALSPIDRTLGFIFGLARGAFLVCLAYLLLDYMNLPPNDRPAWIREARSKPYLEEGAGVLRTFLPEQLKLKNAGFDDLRPVLSPAELTRRASGALASPSSTAPKSDSPAPPSYPSGERRGMDRLIGTQR
jgi:membrane protein required for colicin V production